MAMLLRSFWIAAWLIVSLKTQTLGPKAAVVASGHTEPAAAPATASMADAWTAEIHTAAGTGGDVSGRADGTGWHGRGRCDVWCGLVVPAADADYQVLAAGGLGVAHVRQEPQLLRLPRRHVQLPCVLGREVQVLVAVHDQQR